MRLIFLGYPLLFLFAAMAQTPEPATIQNNGKPIRLPFQCSDDDIQTAGLTCPPGHPCPVYLELFGLETAGASLFLSGNLHTENATLYSVLLATQDGGKTWSEPSNRVRSAGLESIQFIDLETGWVAGQLLAAVPRDPFLLATHDGGKTWQSRPVFSESRTGTIEAFRFDSKTHGMLGIDRSQSGEATDRYESYETTTGGESWVLKETSDQPLRKEPRPPTRPDLRIRADTASRSYRLERRNGARWEPLASFAVRAGDCREPEPAFAPEPPASADEAAPGAKPETSGPTQP